MTALDDLIAERLRAGRVIRFSEFVQLALYHPEHGFYSAGGQAGGRRGDFVTSVEVGPLFAAVVGDWLDDKWRAAGEPTEFRVSEAAAGVGTFFRGIHRSQPACYQALIWTLVETSAVMRAAHLDLPGDRWRSAHELPPERQHVILANELLDNMPFGIAEKTADGWTDVLVGLAAEGAPDDYSRLVLGGELADDWLPVMNGLPVEVPPGTRLPTVPLARYWVETARASADHVLVFDYFATTEELMERGQDGWLRAYRGHQLVTNIFEQIGTFDITHDVPIDQLPPATAVSAQVDWLQTNGIEARVAAARATWRERAPIGDLAAVAARSVVNEAEALTDSTGLGGFWVLEWTEESKHIGR